ncbi:hypothetical protein C8R32_106196 [Nitrosospira sp. Nsp5]|uniref:Uncharacterized protein n=1 Tax=Nitrosospira multiformis TaxID=1231 RepID=A0ABY0T9N2_9PROT|nr:MULTISPECIES: hypothetical protein [Nitrosospira]PTR08113.1 hypothetical protein C8R32_106196 [Nitrosospira sp. Nsp5]SDQ49405.1 hypothetical protein SAMN05216402_1070 [Nitrosospira multiformis]
MSDAVVQECASGTIMGTFVGGASGVGCHLILTWGASRDYDDEITTHTDPKPGRYHTGYKAGQLPQPCFILKLMLYSLFDQGSYDEADFCGEWTKISFPR